MLRFRNSEIEGMLLLFLTKEFYLEVTKTNMEPCVCVCVYACVCGGGCVCVLPWLVLLVFCQTWDNLQVCLGKEVQMLQQNLQHSGSVQLTYKYLFSKM